MWASYPRFFLWHMQCGNWSLWFHEVTPFTFESLAQSHESLEWNPRVLRPWPLKWQWWNERLPNIWSWPRLRAESERASSRPFSQRWIHWNATGYHWAPGLKVELVNLKHPHPIGPDTGRSGGCVKTENTFKPGCGSSNSKVMNIEGLISIIIDIYWYLLYIYGYWIKLSDYPTLKICHSLVHPSCHLPLHQGFQGARHRYVDDMVPYWNLDRAVSPLETSGWGDIQRLAMTIFHHRQESNLENLSIFSWTNLGVDFQPTSVLQLEIFKTILETLTQRFITLPLRSRAWGTLTGAQWKSPSTAFSACPSSALGVKSWVLGVEMVVHPKAARLMRNMMINNKSYLFGKPMSQFFVAPKRLSQCKTWKLGVCLVFSPFWDQHGLATTLMAWIDAQSLETLVSCCLYSFFGIPSLGLFRQF